MTDFPDRDDARTDELQHKIDGLRGRACAGCGRLVCGHDALVGVALGCQDRPHCLPCLAAAFGQAEQDLRDHIGGYVRRRNCYKTVWRREADREASATGGPRCRWQAEESVAAAPTDQAPAWTGAGRFDAAWDAGGMACGDLVLALRLRMNTLPPAAVLKLTALDPAAPEDIPAWCRLTGHTLVAFQHPEYFIQRKEH